MKKVCGAGRLSRASVLSLLAWQAAAQSTVPLTRYPYLQDVRPDRAAVVWTMPELGDGVVQYSIDRSYSLSVRARVAEIPAAVTGLGFAYYKYQANLTGLRPGTEYFYRVMMDGVELVPPEDFRFRTAKPGPFSFLVFGDSGTGGPEQRRLAETLFQERPDIVIHTGDLAYPRGAFSEFRNNHFAVYSPLTRRVPFFPSPGNHDYETPDALPYLMLHTLPDEGVPPPDRGRYYSFDWGDAHFVALDSNLPFREAVAGRGPMLRWLEEDLLRTRRLWRIVYFHHPVRPTSSHEQDPTSALMREHLEPILDRHDVQLVFSGHEHNYQQGAPRRGGRFLPPGSAGTVHIITGGGGGPLYPVAPREGLVFAAEVHHYLRGDVDGPRLTVQAIDIGGRLIDRLTLAHAPVLSAEGVVNAASFTRALAPGSLISIFGRMLALEDLRSASFPLPAELGGTTVALNGRPLPLLFVSRNQINAQLPFDLQGLGTLRVSYAGTAAEVAVTLVDSAPAIFALGPDRPAVLHQNGTPVTESAPAAGGEIVSVFLTGLGRPQGEIAPGTPAPSAPLLQARGPIDAFIGALPAITTFAGLAPGFAGLYQVNVQVPPGLARGRNGLRIVARGAASNTVNLWCAGD